MLQGNSVCASWLVNDYLTRALIKNLENNFLQYLFLFFLILFRIKDLLPFFQNLIGNLADFWASIKVMNDYVRAKCQSLKYLLETLIKLDEVYQNWAIKQKAPTPLKSQKRGGFRRGQTCLMSSTNLASFVKIDSQTKKLYQIFRDLSLGEGVSGVVRKATGYFST